MILQIRTKDNLEELLKQGNSPAWVIAESRVPEIQSVEIYQFDGKRVLKAEFDAANSTRTESDRLVVAFKNGVIEDADMDWNGQNPVRYKDVETAETGRSVLSSIIGKENAERLINLYNSDKQFYQQDGFDFEWLNGIASKAYKNLIISGSFWRSYDIIEHIKEEAFSNKLTTVTDNSSLIDQVKKVENKFVLIADEQSKNSEREKYDNICAHLFCQYIDKINNVFNENGLRIQRTIEPEGGDSFDLIFYFNSEPSDIVNFLIGYHHATEVYPGWWEGSLDIYLKNDREKWLSLRLDAKNIDTTTNDIIYGFRYDSHLPEEEYPSSNFNDFNISKANLFAFVEGAFAAWHYSKIKPAE